MKNFAALQTKILRSILAQGAKTTLFAYLGLRTLHREKDQAVLHMDFASAAPIARYDEMVATLRRAADDKESPPAQLWLGKNFVSLKPPLVLVKDRHKFFPLNKEIFKGLQTAEASFFASIKKKFGVKGQVFDIHETTSINTTSQPPKATLATWMAFHRRKTLPTKNMLEDTGTSRYQSLHTFIAALEKNGKDVEVLVCHPRTLVDISLLLAQKERRFISLLSLCPKLKVLVLRNQGMGIYGKEISYFTQGLSLTVLEMHQTPTGFCAFQHQPNENLTVPTKLSVFLGFVPTEDILGNGHFHKNHKRLHAGDVEVGKDYLMINTNSAGVLAYNTEQVFRVMSLEPLTLKYRRHVFSLNGFGENVPEDVLTNLLVEINEALATYGFFVRDYMVGDHTHNRRALFILEVSRPLNEIKEDVYRAITSRLHGELINRVDSYRRTFQTAAIFPPEIIFVPMGTFANMADDFPRRHIDQTTDARLVTAVVENAFETKRFFALGG